MLSVDMLVKYFIGNEFKLVNQILTVGSKKKLKIIFLFQLFNLPLFNKSVSTG